MLSPVIKEAGHRDLNSDYAYDLSSVVDSCRSKTGEFEGASVEVLHLAQ